MTLDEYGREIDSVKVLFKGKPFILGKCNCGYCNEERSIRGPDGYLRRYNTGHKAKGINNPRYKGWKLVHGGKRMMLYIPWHPNADKHGYVYRYVWVMTRFLKRILKKGETVHHIDRNSLNDDISNLALFESQSEHRHFHRSDYSNKRCSNPICPKPTETFIDKKKGYPSWYLDKDGNDLCCRCYRRQRYHQRKTNN